MTNPISDLANSKCIFIIGSNLAENHAILSRWIHRAKDFGAQVIVADPRLTHTAWLADLFLQLKPGTDVALLNAMMKVIIDENLVDKAFISKCTKGFEDLAKAVEDYTPEKSCGYNRRPSKGYCQSCKDVCPIPGIGDRLLHGHNPTYLRHGQRPIRRQPCSDHRPDREGGHGRSSSAWP